MYIGKKKYIFGLFENYMDAYLRKMTTTRQANNNNLREMVFILHVNDFLMIDEMKLLFIAFYSPTR